MKHDDHEFLEIFLPENETDDAFLKIKETLTRIGIPSYKDRSLTQTCHIFHKKGRYYLCHFKEMFILDGKPSTLDEQDIQRRNTVAEYLVSWELCSVPNIESLKKTKRGLRVLRFGEKQDWELRAKHSIGRR